MKKKNNNLSLYEQIEGTYEGHMILYCKGWYKSDNMIEDLKKIISIWYLVKTEDMNESYVVCRLFTIIKEYQNQLFKGNYDLLYFLSDIAPENTWNYGYTHSSAYGLYASIDKTLPPYDYWTAIVYKMVSMIRSLRVINDDGSYIVKTPRPDTKVLPFADHITEEKIEQFWSEKEKK